MKRFILILSVVCLIAFDAYVLRSARKSKDRPPPSEDDQTIVSTPPTGDVTTPAAVAGARLNPSPKSADTTVGTPAAKGAKAPRSKIGKGWSLADVIPGEFVLSFYDDNDRKAFIELARLKGGEILGLMDFRHTVRLRCRNQEWLDELLKESPRPVDSSPNFYVRVPEVSGKTSETPESNYRPFGAGALRWLGVSGDCSTWGKGVVVAILDTGVGLNSALAESNVTRLNELPAAAGQGEYSGHGTAVASLLAGTTAALPGVAPASLILSVQVLSGDGTGDAFTVAKGIVDAADHEARVLNLSLGTHSDCFILEQAVDYAQERGSIVVAAVGNDGVEDVSYPARYEGVIAVSAVDAAGRHLFFSNRGPEVDVAAPGLGVDAASASGEGAVSFSGTSAAVPFVSGTLAALLSQSPQMTTGEALEVLYRYCNDTGAPGADPETGNGILNVGWIMNRNISGMYDVTVCSPYLQPRKSRDDDVVVTIYLQNRGTESLRHVQMKVTLDGVDQSLDFYDIGVGKTVGHDSRVDPERMRQPAGVALACTATIDGADDINPADNTCRTVLYLRASAGAAP